MTHGSPSPRKTLTQLEPVTFPIALSANSKVRAAVILARVSGSDVPIATKVIAVTEALRPIAHPRIVATSPTNIVTIPMNARAMKKAGTPPPIYAGGTSANITFQPMQAKWNSPSDSVTSSMIRLSSSMHGPSFTASFIWEEKVFSWLCMK